MLTEKKKIMLIVPMLDQGGLERVCALTAQMLKNKYQVYLVVFDTTGMIYDVSGVNLIDLKLGAVPSMIGKVSNILKRRHKVRKLKRNYQIDVSYSFGQTANLINVLSKYQDEVWAGIRGYGALSGKWMMKFVCASADRIISCTRVMEAEIVKQYQPKVFSTLYNPCDTKKIMELAQDEDAEENLLPDVKEFINRPGKMVVSMGRAHDVKGFWHLLKAMSIVKKSLPDSRLLIIGAGDYSEYIKLARELNMAESVLFTGVQKNPFVLLAKCDLYALTSESEGFPNALIEAMAVGVPCVSVNCKTGPAEILQEDYEQCQDQHKVYMADYGILTPVFTGQKNLEAKEISQEEQVFAEQIIRLLADEKLYNRYCKKARQCAGKFGVTTYVSNIERLIEANE